MGSFPDIKFWRARLEEWLSTSIYHRITVSALSLAMGVALVVGVSSYAVVAVLIHHSTKAELNTQSRLTLQELQGDLQALWDDLATMSTNSFIANGLVDSLGRDTYLLPFLHEHKPGVPFSTSFILCDFRGRPIASNTKAGETPDLSLASVAEVLSEAKPKGELQQLAHGTYLVLIHPVIFPPTGQAEGALVETVKLQDLFDADTRHLGREYSVRLIAAGKEAAKAGNRIDEEDLITVQHRLDLDPPLNQLQLSFEIGLSRRGVSQPLRLLTLIYLLSGTLLLALVLKYAKATAKRLTMPLISLSTTASRIADSGSLDLKAEVCSKDEVGTLAEVFNQMLTKLRASQEHLESEVENRTRELKEAHDLLEARVALRTRELTEANLRLEQEIENKTRLEQQLRQVQKMEAIGTLAGGIAHDFNNILTVIGSYSSLAAMRMAENDPSRRNLTQIVAATEKAAHLTRSLLAFSRKQVMNSQDTDLNVIITNLEHFLGRVIGEDIKLTTRLRDEKLWVHLDRGQIEQVLMNLATNARDAMPRGGILGIETTLQALDEEYIAAHGFSIAPGRYAMVTVSDSGCGMDRETMRKIFEPFYTTKEVGKGTGLGLSMAYGIIKQHNGHITVYSEPGHGTTFKMYLPLLDTAPFAAKEGLSLADTTSGGNETLLVAEDDGEVREVVNKILTEAGYRVVLAVDGQDAVEKFTSRRDDVKLVILDMIMPNKSGKEAYDEIMALNPSVRVLFSSGYTADFIQNRGDLHDGADLIMKPVHPNELLKKVRQMLDGGKSR